MLIDLFAIQDQQEVAITLPGSEACSSHMSSVSCLSWNMLSYYNLLHSVFISTSIMMIICICIIAAEALHLTSLLASDVAKWLGALNVAGAGLVASCDVCAER